MYNNFFCNSLFIVVFSSFAIGELNAHEDGVGESQHSLDLQKLSTEKEKIYNQMASMIAAATCEIDAQCASMPVGNADCGGPANYLVYSKMIGDEAVAKLTLLAEHTKQLDVGIAQFKQAAGTATYGICKVNTPKDVSCVDNVCKEIDSEVIR